MNSPSCEVKKYQVELWLYLEIAFLFDDNRKLRGI